MSQTASAVPERGTAHLFGKRRTVRRGADPPKAAAKGHPLRQKAHPADDGRHGADQL